jgi:DNA repair protein RadC
MDDIQRVDCFERLHRHLLQHEPSLPGRVAALDPDGFRKQNLSFFISHLTALVCGIDAQTAEGQRRLRRLIQDIDGPAPVESAERHLAVRERASARSIAETQKRGLREAFDCIRSLSDDPELTGEAFFAEMGREENLPGRIGRVRTIMPCLTGLNTYRYLNAIGFPVAIPDAACRAVLFRLGLIDSASDSGDAIMRVALLIEETARLVNRSVLELDLWIRVFDGSLRDSHPSASLCTRTPRCASCPVSSYCSYFRYQRPRAQDANAPLPFSQWRPTERPRERLLEFGSHRLEDAELLAIVLRTGSGKVHVLELARRLLDRFGSLQAIEEAAIKELMEVHGVGQMKAIELKAVFELGRRLAIRPIRPGDSVSASEEVFRAYRGRFARVKQEEFLILMLDNKNRVIREDVVSRGGLDETIVHPREVFKSAIRASAASVIFVHNHPSGDPTPSPEDIDLTERLREAGELLQIRMLDHVIVGNTAFFSFADGEIVEAEECGM